MSKTETDRLLRKLMLHKSGKARVWSAWVALFAGILLLLCAVTIWWDFQQLLHGRNQNDSLGSTFLTINKKITNENMARPSETIFSEKEIENLRKAPQVQDVGVLAANHFPVAASMGSTLGFYTQLFLEAVPDRFMDNKTTEWNWKEGDMQVPIIVSGEFLNLYNYGFAPSQGLPQLSESTIKSLGFDLTIGGATQEKYTGHIVGFSDRINSVLVPEAFLQYANRKFGTHATSQPSRLIVKAKDPSDKQFVEYLNANNYATNAEQLRWNKLRAIVETVTLATGILAVLLIGIGTLVFVLFIELTFAKATEAVKLLLQLGYKPSVLGRFMAKRFAPFIISAVLLSVFVVAGLQLIGASGSTSLQLELPLLPGWPVWLAAIISAMILFYQMSRTIKKALNKV